MIAKFITESTLSVTGEELEALTDILVSERGDDVSEAAVTAKQCAPNLWLLLKQLAHTPAQQKQNPQKDPTKVSNEF